MPELSESCSLFLFMGIVYYLKRTKEATGRQDEELQYIRNTLKQNGYQIYLINKYIRIGYDKQNFPDHQT